MPINDPMGYGGMISQLQQGGIRPTHPAMLPMGLPGQMPQPQQQQGGLGGLLNQLQSNPAAIQALLSASAQVMQPIQPGGSVAGNIGQGITRGLDTFNQVQGRLAQEASANKRTDIYGRQVDVQEKAVDANIEGQKAAQERDIARAPLEDRLLELQTRAAELELDPATRNLGNSLKQAEIALRHAQADAQRAGASADRAKASAQTRSVVFGPLFKAVTDIMTDPIVTDKAMQAEAVRNIIDLAIQAAPENDPSLKRLLEFAGQYGVGPGNSAAPQENSNPLGLDLGQ